MHLMKYKICDVHKMLDTFPVICEKRGEKKNNVQHNYNLHHNAFPHKTSTMNNFFLMKTIYDHKGAWTQF